MIKKNKNKSIRMRLDTATDFIYIGPLFLLGLF